MIPISDHLAARIRTLWPYALGLAAGWLIAQQWAQPILRQLDHAGVHTDIVTVTAALGWVAGAAIYGGGRWLEQRPGPGRAARLARAAGRWLLSLGLHTGQPAYPTSRTTAATPQPPTQMRTGSSSSHISTV